MAHVFAYWVTSGSQILVIGYLYIGMSLHSSLGILVIALVERQVIGILQFGSLSTALGHWFILTIRFVDTITRRLA